MASPDAELWQRAMDEEMASLMANKTWTLEEAPPGIKPIPVKWVFKIKRDSNGNIERYKARLLAKGFRQRESIDYQERCLYRHLATRRERPWTERPTATHSSSGS